MSALWNSTRLDTEMLQHFPRCWFRRGQRTLCAVTPVSSLLVALWSSDILVKPVRSPFCSTWHTHKQCFCYQSLGVRLPMCNAAQFHFPCSVLNSYFYNTLFQGSVVNSPYIYVHTLAFLQSFYIVHIIYSYVFQKDYLCDHNSSIKICIFYRKNNMLPCISKIYT